MKFLSLIVSIAILAVQGTWAGEAAAPTAAPTDDQKADPAPAATMLRGSTSTSSNDYFIKLKLKSNSCVSFTTTMASSRPGTRTTKAGV